MLNYLEGAHYCRTNSKRLETSARILLENSDGTDSFGLFLYNISYEEMAKGIFCLFVHKGYVPENFISKVFQDHKSKIALFEEIFPNLAFQGNTCRLGGKPLGETSLEEFIEKHDAKIIEHRKETTDLLYVNKKGKWITPEVEISNIKDKETKIRSKISALDMIFHSIENELFTDKTEVSNFRLGQKSNGNFFIKYDVI